MNDTQAQAFFKALLDQDTTLGASRYIAQHLARVKLHNLKGIDALEANIESLAQVFITQARAVGFNIAIGETYRSAENQEILYAQGRTMPGAIVTNARGLQSYHQYGLAFDIYFVDAPHFPADDLAWRQLAGMATKIGLTPGYDFGDKPHFEYHPGFTWHDLIEHFTI